MEDDVIEEGDDSEFVNQSVNPRLDRLDSIHQSLAPRIKVPEEKEPPKPATKGVQNSPGFAGEPVTSIHKSGEWVS